MVNSDNYKELKESFDSYEKAGGVKMALKEKKGEKKKFLRVIRFIMRQQQI